MLFGLRRVLMEELSAQEQQKERVQIYVATDMSPIEQSGASQELREAIEKSSPRVRELFGRAMRRVVSE